MAAASGSGRPSPRALPMLDPDKTIVGSLDDVVEGIAQHLRSEHSKHGGVLDVVQARGPGRRDWDCCFSVFEGALRAGFHDSAQRSGVAKRQRGERSRRGGALEVAVVGHGGRDSTCCLTVFEGALRAGLHDSVRVHVISCSWPEDDWEPCMEEFMNDLTRRGIFPAGHLKMSVLKWHQEHHLVMAKLASFLEGVHVVVQGEQGVDMFVEPVTSEWLQDNYEDHCAHYACTDYCARNGALSLIVQTNANMDLHRGIDKAEVSKNLFKGLLSEHSFSDKIKPFGVPGPGAPGGPDDPFPFPETLIKLAIVLSTAKDKKQVFDKYLNLDPSTYESVSSTYVSYMMFSGFRSNANIPIAGITELVLYLMQSGHKLPWELRDKSALPSSQWVLARSLLPGEVPQGELRVVKQFRGAGLHDVRTMGEYLARWMFARRGQRVRANTVDPKSRSLKSFWTQLVLAKALAEHLRRECPDLDLGQDQCQVLQRALEIFEQQADTEATVKSECEKRQAGAEASQEDFKLSPLCLIVNAWQMSILDFSCRLLEAGSSGLQGEAELIAAGFPDPPGQFQTTREELLAPGCVLGAAAVEQLPKLSVAVKDLLARSLVMAWRERTGRL